MVTFDAAKRAANLAKHGIDLADCESVFDFPMLTIEDSREAYGEQRLKSLGWLADRVVVLVWTDRDAGPHLISCRHGDQREANRYFQSH
ncbi:MAG: BrnT family toxin [Xanthomonadales bacterium]|nr:BrnT family toxin [Xanthomonadales bacterium]